MEIREELLVEATEELLAAERALQDCEDRSRWRKLIGEVTRREENFDCIASRIAQRLPLMGGLMSKLLVQAIAYRVTRKKLYGRDAWVNGKDKEYMRHWYQRWERARRQLRETVELYHDEEARRTGKAVRWVLMEKHCGRTHVVSTSPDKDYIRALHSDAISRPHPGTSYFMAKQYVELNKNGKEP